MNFRYFPLALYLRMFGAAGIGYAVGRDSIFTKPLLLFVNWEGWSRK